MAAILANEATFTQNVRAHTAIAKIMAEYNPCFLEIKVDGNVVNPVVQETYKRDYFAVYRSNASPQRAFDLALLQSMGTPAPFGKDQTVMDTSVRNAMEISADRIEITNAPGFNNIVKQLQHVAPFGKRFVPKLYKFHMYGAGGHFNKHRDTIHAPNHHATLIVSLGICDKYEGGDLILDVDGKTNTIDLKCYNPIKSGLRVVVQYDVYLQDAAVTNEPECEQPKMRMTKMKKKKEDKDYSDRSYYSKTVYKTLALMNHAELNAAKLKIIPLLTKVLTEHPNDHLKRVLHEILKEHFEVDRGWAVNTFTTDDVGNFSSNLMTDDADVESRNKENHEEEGGNAQSDIATETGGSYKEWIFFGNGTGFWQEKSQEYVEYTGNESALGDYVYVSFVLSVGPTKK
ncbi:hypothetical protein HK100_000719 [Physocladia obscura]|uniref:Uncharacterized protein n=1 Tax=Physocladia obscura TaxID=109957 RepID=A0AAD5SZP5_9FUNG|nr:hypothetical protein HK100_000719 [Physocladia obscura]